MGETSGNALEICKYAIAPLIPQLAKGRRKVTFVIHIVFLSDTAAHLLEGFQGGCRGKIRRTFGAEAGRANAPIFLAECSDVEVAAHGCEQQCTNMRLQYEF